MNSNARTLIALTVAIVATAIKSAQTTRTKRTACNAVADSSSKLPHSHTNPSKKLNIYCTKSKLRSCRVSRQCIPDFKQCDGVIDCKDHLDERQCSGKFTSQGFSRVSLKLNKETENRKLTFISTSFLMVFWSNLINPLHLNFFFLLFMFDFDFYWLC